MSEEPLFDPRSVLAAAFGGHDFIGQLGGQEITIQTSDPSFEGNTAYIEVDAMTNPMDHGVSYRYRIEFDGAGAASPPDEHHQPGA